MGYKLLGFVIWQRYKWNWRRRYKRARHDLALAGLAALIVGGVVGGVVAAQRASSPHRG
jgi:hypothetical protein